MANLKEIKLHHPGKPEPEVRDFSRKIGEALYYNGMTPLALEVGERLINGEEWRMTKPERALVLETLRNTPLYITREIVKALQADDEE